MESVKRCLGWLTPRRPGCWWSSRSKGCNVCNKCCGCLRRQQQDARDHRWVSLPPARVPRRHRLPDIPPSLNQGDIAACAVNACANALTMCMRKRGLHAFRASRMFLYYNTRRHIMKQRDFGCDTGCTLRDVCKAACKFGACNEGEWPYKSRLLRTAPPVELYEKAKRLPRIGYKAVPQSVKGIVSCLAQGYPVLLGISLFSNLEETARTGVLPLPRPCQDQELGRHAVLLCGYDLDSRTFWVQNCWGARWGDRGFFQIPFEYVLDAGKCWDLWVLV